MARAPLLLVTLVICSGFVAILLFKHQSIFDQLGALFDSGPAIETIGTESLNTLLADRRRRIERAKMSGKVVEQADFVVVDVRSQKEVQVSVIPGAITQEMFEKTRDDYRGRLVIPYCTVGGRSRAYAKQLARKGVRVKNYQGSILKWVANGLPLVTLQGEPTQRVHTYSDRYTVPAQYEQVTK